MATFWQIPNMPTKQNLVHARDCAGRLYVAKTQACSKIGTNPTWIGNELIYYVIAHRSRLQMPFSAILTIDGKLYWGSEYIQTRDALSNQEGNEVLRRTCKRSRQQLLGLARALLLDIALLNSDRMPWNILASQNGDLWYFDHDKSLLGDGRETNENPPGDLGRIESASVTDYKIGDYLACKTANQLVLGCLSDQEVSEIFKSLVLNADILKAARADCPQEWIPDKLFLRLEQFLLNWWSYLQERFLAGNPRCYLTHILLKRGLV